MPTCASCSGELAADWRFCVFCGTAVTPAAVTEAAAESPRRFNPLAVVALVLACVGGAPAIIFGHLALRQIAQTGERGRAAAIVATVLGYLWLVVVVVLVVRYAGGL